MSNDFELRKLQYANIELSNLMERFIADTDAIFNSKTWKLGFFFAEQYRRLMRFSGDKRKLAHIGPRHFHELTRDCHARVCARDSDTEESAPATAPESFGSAVQDAPAGHGQVLTAAHQPADSQLEIPDIPMDYIVGDVDMVVQDLWGVAHRGAVENG